MFKAEGKPLQDRITAGLELVEQMEAEGIVGKELAAQLRAVADQASIHHWLRCISKVGCCSALRTFER